MIYTLLIFCQFQPDVTFKNAAYKKVVYASDNVAFSLQNKKYLTVELILLSKFFITQ